MASKSVSFSQVTLAVAMVVLAIHAQGSVASDFCKKCNPGAEWALCASMVKGAKTWDEALTNVVTTILGEVRKAKPIVQTLESKLPASLLAVSKDSLDKTCKDLLGSLEDALHNTLNYIKNGDPMQSIPTELSAATSLLSDCTDGLSEFGADIPALSKLGDTVAKYASISLAVTQIKYTYT